MTQIFNSSSLGESEEVNVWSCRIIALSNYSTTSDNQSMIKGDDIDWLVSEERLVLRCVVTLFTHKKAPSKIELEWRQKITKVSGKLRIVISVENTVWQAVTYRKKCIWQANPLIGTPSSTSGRFQRASLQSWRRVRGAFPWQFLKGAYTRPLSYGLSRKYELFPSRVCRWALWFSPEFGRKRWERSFGKFSLEEKYKKKIHAALWHPRRLLSF